MSTRKIPGVVHRESRADLGSGAPPGRSSSAPFSRALGRATLRLIVLSALFLCQCSSQGTCWRGEFRRSGGPCPAVTVAAAIPIEWVHARESRARGRLDLDHFAELEAAPPDESVRFIVNGIRTLPEDWFDGHLIADAVQRVWRVNSRKTDFAWRLAAMDAMDSLIADPEISYGRKRVALLEVAIPLAVDDDVFIEHAPKPFVGYRVWTLSDRSLRAKVVASVLQVIECLRHRPVEILRLGNELVKLGYWMPEMIAPLQQSAMDLIDTLDKALETDAMAVRRLVAFFWHYRSVVSEDLVAGLLRLGRQDRLPDGEIYTVLLIALSRPGELRALGVDILSNPGRILDQQDYTELVHRYAAVVPDELLASLVANVVATGFSDSLGEDGVTLADVRRRIFPGVDDAEDFRGLLERGKFRWSPDIDYFMWDPRRELVPSKADR